MSILSTYQHCSGWLSYGIEHDIITKKIFFHQVYAHQQVVVWLEKCNYGKKQTQEKQNKNKSRRNILTYNFKYNNNKIEDI